MTISERPAYRRVSSKSCEIVANASAEKFRDELTLREQTMLEMRFALTGTEPPQTLAAIGQRYHLTRERVRQIIEEALHKLGVDPYV